MADQGGGIQVKAHVDTHVTVNINAVHIRPGQTFTVYMVDNDDVYVKVEMRVPKDGAPQIFYDGHIDVSNLNKWFLLQGVE